jgi:acyl carrier protein phosphodiesterase
MNFLAHAYLSFDDPDVLVGNMIADALKGNQADQYPGNIRKGIYLHRNIDHYTDHHPLVRTTRKIFYPVISHYALVISDVIYDHFLGTNWNKYHPGTLFDFSQKAYSDIDHRMIFIPEKFQRIFGFMKDDNWFLMYSKREGIHKTIDRLQYRSKGFTKAKETIEVFEKNYNELEDHFLEFFPQLIESSKEFLSSSSNYE